ncbi:MAG: SemiSWEET family transporter [Patescibacteria group bacterium]|jgi:uncharacterized protein with PQ loop repeat
MDWLQTITLAGVVAVLTTMMGIIVKVVGLPDQIRKNYKRQSTEGLSTLFIWMTFIAYILWTLHGILRKDWVLIIGQGLGIVTTGIILWQIFIYRNKA